MKIHMTGKEMIRFIAVMTGFALVLFCVYREEQLGSLLTPFTVLTANMTLSLLHLSGMDAVVKAATQIHHPDGFAYEIYYRCIGFLPVTIFTVSIMAYPGAMTKKILGLFLGVPILVAINFIRLVRLFLYRHLYA